MDRNRKSLGLSRHSNFILKEILLELLGKMYAFILKFNEKHVF